MTAADVKQQQYNAEQIQVLEGLEPVRKRPGMYIGTTGPKGLHHLVYEVVDNSIDEAIAGFCKNINVTIRPDNSIVVEDDGRGMPVDLHSKLKIPAVELPPFFTPAENSAEAAIKSPEAFTVWALRW